MKGKRMLAIACTAAILSVTALTCMAFTGCDFSLEGLFHTHNVDTSSWQMNESGHWHVCSSCEAKVDYSIHHYISASSSICLVCGWNRSSGSEDSSGGGSGGTTPLPDDEGEVEMPDTPESIDDAYILLHADSDYGYRWLGVQTNGSKLQAYYNEIGALCERVVAGTATITKVDRPVGATKDYYSAGKLETHELTLNQVKIVYNTYCYDHPYNFWQDQALLTNMTEGSPNYCHVLIVDDYVRKVGTKYQASATISTKRTELNANIKTLYNAADSAASVYEIAAAYYEAIGKLGDYTYEDGEPANSYWAHSIVGLLDNSLATGPVCECYARVYQLMLNLRGVENVYCIGTATSDGWGGGGGHAWNMVRLDDGKWYYCDLTWDDGNDGLRDNAHLGLNGTVVYRYFAVSSAEAIAGKRFTQTHTAGRPALVSSYFLYDLPTASTSAFSLADFRFGAESTSNSQFNFRRTGLDTVGISAIKKADSGMFNTNNRVTIPSSVTIGEKTYRVTELGPKFASNGAYTAIGNLKYTISLPKSVVAIHSGTFYISNTKITIDYAGTRAEWALVTQGNNAFTTAPTVNCIED